MFQDLYGNDGPSGRSTVPLSRRVPPCWVPRWENRFASGDAPLLSLGMIRRRRFLWSEGPAAGLLCHCATVPACAPPCRVPRWENRFASGDAPLLSLGMIKRGRFLWSEGPAASLLCHCATVPVCAPLSGSPMGKSIRIRGCSAPQFGDDQETTISQERGPSACWGR